MGGVWLTHAWPDLALSRARFGEETATARQAEDDLSLAWQRRFSCFRHHQSFLGAAKNPCRKLIQSLSISAKAASQSTQATTVVSPTFIHKRGRSGAPRQPEVSSACSTAWVPIGSTANRGTHQIRM